ncbi:MAG TPA: hypothetical protein ENG75_03815 [Nitrospirae bacterium]|nr:hypothetical protein [Nitrospirota bacterium]
MGKNINLSTRILIHSSVGCLAGLVFLHPVSMFIFNIYGHNTMEHFFDPGHLLMAVYFSLLGGAIGFFNGLYIHKKNLTLQGDRDPLHYR